MSNARKMKNPAARMWTKTELNATVKQCRKSNFTIEKYGDTTTITNPDNGDIVLMSLFTGKVEMVRIDKSYFEEPDYGYTPSTINTSIYNDF